MKNVNRARGKEALARNANTKRGVLGVSEGLGGPGEKKLFECEHKEKGRTCQGRGRTKESKYVVFVRHPPYYIASGVGIIKKYFKNGVET